MLVMLLVALAMRVSWRRLFLVVLAGTMQGVPSSLLHNGFISNFGLDAKRSKGPQPCFFHFFLILQVLFCINITFVSMYTENPRDSPQSPLSSTTKLTLLFEDQIMSPIG